MRFSGQPVRVWKPSFEKSGYTDEVQYNGAMIKACQEHGVQVVALTDHFRFDDSESLRAKLEESGIVVFPGFEANSADGVHILCLFPPGSSNTDMNANVGACDIRNRDDPSPISRKGFEEILACVHERGGITISAHVTQSSGLLKELSGQPRMNAWKSPLHLASAIPDRSMMYLLSTAKSASTKMAHTNGIGLLAF